MSSSFYSQIGIPSTSSTAIESSVQQAATSETNAAASATSSATSASAASASAVSANAADVSATQAKNDAETAATASLGYSQQAAAHVSTASGHEQAALASANYALQHSNNASTFATNSSNSATASATSAADSATSATNSATSATNSATSATASAASATSAAASLSTFQNQYLGASATAPTQDPDGSSLDLGDLYFDTAANVMKVYSDSGWVNASSSVNGTSERQTYTATAGQTTFNVTYDAGYVDVWLNGAKLLAGTDFTATSGTNIVLASPAAANDIVDIIAFGTFVFTQSDHYTKTQSDARYVASSSLNGDIDTHLNQSSATSGQYLKWNGSDYAWDTVAAGYTDSDVDAHLLTAGLTLDATNDRLGVNNASPATALDVTGTVTADGLTVDGDAVISSANARLRLKETDTTNNDTQLQSTGGVFKISRLDDNNSTATPRFTIDNSTGDISFYEDTGTTAKLFWDASAEALGIGTTSINGKLDITGSGNTDVYINTGNNSGDNSRIFFGDTADIDVGYLAYDHGTNAMVFGVNAGERMRIDSGGKVGIGTSSPSRQLHVSGSGANTRLRVENTTGSSVLDVYAEDGGNSTLNYSSVLTMSESGTERMRIDSSGNLLVGQTSPNNTVTGFAARANSLNSFCRDTSTSGAAVLAINKKTGDGTILVIQKDGSTVGSISSSGTTMGIGNNSNAGIRFASSRFNPTSGAAIDTDNLMDIGNTGARFDDIYATNGTIQTSDEREKQNIASLTDAEMTAAKAISKLFKTFKWNDKVEAKGDAARTHTGVIAQQVETAMSDAGLNAGNYAFFISTTWWETQTEVAAVEAVEAQDAVYEDVVIPAVEEVLDEDGNVVTEAQPERTEQRLVSEAVEAVEAQDAYTRTDQYYTQEEAPEGATERNRKGIRYPELLSFIGAATEQRLANLETRVEALEAN